MTISNIEKEFDYNFGEKSGIYYGKDINSDRIFIPNGALEDIKAFYREQIEKREKEVREEVKKEILSKISAPWLYTKDENKYPDTRWQRENYGAGKYNQCL